MVFAGPKVVKDCSFEAKPPVFKGKVCKKDEQLPSLFSAYSMGSARK